ncbi:MAG: hypothetical protein AB7G37_15055 [Solirubrobacteraceae bacterium]
MTRILIHLRTLLLVVGIAALPAAVVPGTASASITSECTGSIPKGKYTSEELQSALDKLDGGLADYSDCADNIYRALQDAAAGSSGGGSGAGGSGGGSTGGSSTGSSGTPPTTPATPDRLAGVDNAAPEERQRSSDEAQKITDAAKDAPVLRIDDDEIPTDALALGATGQSLPTSLLLALIAVAGAAALAGLAATVQTVRRRRGS